MHTSSSFSWVQPQNAELNPRGVVPVRDAHDVRVRGQRSVGSTEALRQRLGSGDSHPASIAAFSIECNVGPAFSACGDDIKEHTE